LNSLIFIDKLVKKQGIILSRAWCCACIVIFSDQRNADDGSL